MPYTRTFPSFAEAPSQSTERICTRFSDESLLIREQSELLCLAAGIILFSFGKRCPGVPGHRGTKRSSALQERHDHLTARTTDMDRDGSCAVRSDDYLRVFMPDIGTKHDGLTALVAEISLHVKMRRINASGLDDMTCRAYVLVVQFSREPRSDRLSSTGRVLRRIRLPPRQPSLRKFGLRGGAFYVSARCRSARTVCALVYRHAASISLYLIPRYGWFRTGRSFRASLGAPNLWRASRVVSAGCSVCCGFIAPCIGIPFS